MDPIIIELVEAALKVYFSTEEQQKEKTRVFAWIQFYFLQIPVPEESAAWEEKWEEFEALRRNNDPVARAVDAVVWWYHRRTGFGYLPSVQEVVDAIVRDYY